VSVVSGGVRATPDGNGTRSPFGQKLTRGDTVLAPFAGSFTLAAETTTILLITEDFAD